MERDSVADAAAATAEELGREFFAAIDARDPRRLRATLANHASFRALPHRELIRPADEIVAYFGTVVSSCPTATGPRYSSRCANLHPTWAVSCSPSRWLSCAPMGARSPASLAITTQVNFASSSGA